MENSSDVGHCIDVIGKRISQCQFLSHERYCIDLIMTSELNIVTDNDIGYDDDNDDYNEQHEYDNDIYLLSIIYYVISR